jgi:hypothetical protein
MPLKNRYRELLIEEMLLDIESWEYDDLIEYVKNNFGDYYNSLDDDELIQEYRAIFGDDCPDSEDR